MADRSEDMKLLNDVCVFRCIGLMGVSIECQILLFHDKCISKN